MANPWFVFARKMKWVLYATLTSLVASAGAISSDVFKDYPWAVFIPVALPFIAGYIPKEEPAPA